MGLVPRERAAIGGVVATAEADLVAVVDRRCARQGALQQGRHPQRRVVPADHREGPRRVVRADEVELDRDDVGVVDTEQIGQPGGEPLPVQRAQVLAVLVVGVDDPEVEAWTAHEAEDGLAERVVHQGVETVVADPPRRDLPDLPDEVRVGTDGSASTPELRPEGRVLDLLRDVQAPTIDPEAQPVLGDREEVLAGVGMVGIDLRQRR